MATSSNTLRLRAAYNADDPRMASSQKPACAASHSVTSNRLALTHSAYKRASSAMGLSPPSGLGSRTIRLMRKTIGGVPANSIARYSLASSTRASSGSCLISEGDQKSSPRPRDELKHWSAARKAATVRGTALRASVAALVRRCRLM